jgi:predicted Rossmann fold nucleotide-binding protein DprA/Smf involved in DNA uptake
LPSNPCLKSHLTNSMQLIGNSQILFSNKNEKWSLFCSNRCPGSIILKSYDIAQFCAKKNITIVSGFHSVVEKEMLQLILEGNANIVICPARSLTHYKIPVPWRKSIQDGRMLLLSPFQEKYRRPTAELTWQRNIFAASISDKVLFLHATPGGKLEKLAKDVKKWHHNIFYLDDPNNYNLKNVGINIWEKGLL